MSAAPRPPWSGASDRLAGRPKEETLAELLRVVRRHQLAIFALVIFTLVAWVVWSARGALPAFLIGLALAFVLDPIVTILNRHGVPRWLGVLVSYAGLAAVVWVIIAFAIPPIAEQTREFTDHLPEYGAALGQVGQDIDAWYRGLALPEGLRQMIDDAILRGEEALIDFARGLAGPLLNTLLRTATFVVGLIIVPIWLFFVLKDRERLPDAVAGAMPAGWRADVRNILAILARVGGRWVRGMLLLGFSIFLATFIGLSILTVAGFEEFGRFTLILALIAGIFEWFPIIGPILAAVPAILIALTISPAAALIIIALYTGIQQLENNLLVPKVMGDAVQLHPAVLIVGLVVGGALFGIGGAILAAPVVSAGRDLYRYGFLRLSGEVPHTAAELIRGPRRVVTEAASTQVAAGAATIEAPTRRAANPDRESRS
jgi:predicted PurR-regulated permease PerM